MYATSLGMFPLHRGLIVSVVARIQAGAWGWEEQQAGGQRLLPQRQQPHERRAARPPAAATEEQEEWASGTRAVSCFLLHGTLAFIYLVRAVSCFSSFVWFSLVLGLNILFCFGRGVIGRCIYSSNLRTRRGPWPFGICAVVCMHHNLLGTSPSMEFEMKSPRNCCARQYWYLPLPVWWQTSCSLWFTWYMLFFGRKKCMYVKGRWELLCAMPSWYGMSLTDAIGPNVSICLSIKVYDDLKGGLVEDHRPCVC